MESLLRLHLKRVSSLTHPVHEVSIPSFRVIAQGSKEVYLGEASNDRPHLSLRLDLTPSLVGSVMVEASFPSPRGPANAKAIDVSPLDTGLLDAAVRLVRLLDTPGGRHVKRRPVTHLPNKRPSCPRHAPCSLGVTRSDAGDHQGNPC